MENRTSFQFWFSRVRQIFVSYFPYFFFLTFMSFWFVCSFSETNSRNRFKLQRWKCVLFFDFDFSFFFRSIRRSSHVILFIVSLSLISHVWFPYFYVYHSIYFFWFFFFSSFVLFLLTFADRVKTIYTICNTVFYRLWCAILFRWIGIAKWLHFVIFHIQFQPDRYAEIIIMQILKKTKSSWYFHFVREFYDERRNWISFSCQNTVCYWFGCVTFVFALFLNHTKMTKNVKLISCIFTTICMSWWQSINMK